MQMETGADVAPAVGDVALETIPKFPYLVGAYGAFFLILFVYVLTLHARTRRMEREIAALAAPRR